MIKRTALYEFLKANKAPDLVKNKTKILIGKNLFSKRDQYDIVQILDIMEGGCDNIDMVKFKYCTGKYQGNTFIADSISMLSYDVLTYMKNDENDTFSFDNFLNDIPYK